MDSHQDIAIIKSLWDDSVQRCLTQDYVIKAKQAEIENKDRIIRILNKRLKDKNERFI